MNLTSDDVMVYRWASYFSRPPKNVKYLGSTVREQVFILTNDNFLYLMNICLSLHSYVVWNLKVFLFTLPIPLYVIVLY